MITGTGWLFIVIAVAANIGANIALKIAVTSGPKIEGIGQVYFLIIRFSFLISLVLAAVLFLSYLMAVRSIPVSVAYVCVTSLAMVGLAAVEWMAFGTAITPLKFIGTVLVLTGVALIALGK